MKQSNEMDPVPVLEHKQSGGWHLWVGLLVLAAVGVSAYFVVHRLTAGLGNAAAGRGNHPVPVVAATARRGDMPLYLTGLGNVTPLNTVTVRSRVDGQILKIDYVEGQMVKQGDLLIQIDPAPYQAQLKQAQGQLAKDQASLDNANRDLQRYESIKSSITQQQIDTQLATVEQFKGTVEADQGQVANANLQLGWCSIAAPIPGRIGLRAVDVGNIVHASDQAALAVITQVQPITVVFTVSEDQISQVFARPDHGKGLAVEAYNRDLTQKLADGSVLAIDNQVDPATGTVRIKAEFPNEDQVLFPNEFVNVRLLVDVRRGAVIVPAAAIQHGPDSSYVYVVRGEPGRQKVALRDVTPGPTEGSQTLVEKGLSPGEVVVTEGVDKLTDGSAVAASGPKPAAGSTTRPSNGAAPTTQAVEPTSRPAGLHGKRNHG